VKNVFSDGQFREDNVILWDVADDLLVFGDNAWAAVDFCYTTSM